MTPIEKLIAEDQKKPRRILIIGDGMRDVYVHGYISNCQEVCPKFTQESRVQVPGGAANAARSLTHWRARQICIFSSRDAAIKTRFMVGNKCVFRYDDETTTANYNVVRDESLKCLHDWKPEGLLLSDYNKGMITPEFSREVIAECARVKIPCVVDPKQEPSIYAGAVIKCNELYAEQFFRSWSDESIIVTCGKNGPYRLGATFPSGPTVPCVNHVGAGDCFAAHLTLALACGLSIDESTMVAHSAGRVYVQYPHNRPPHPEEISLDMISTVTA